jgi:hypothetical protein
MHKTAVTGLAAISLVIAFAAAADTPAPPAEATLIAAPSGLPIAPGFWEGRVSALVISGRDRRCLQGADVERYVHGWSSHVYACTYPVSTVGGGHVVWHGTCSSRGGRHLTIDAVGDYTATQFRVRGHVGSRLMGINISAPFTMTARRLGDCSQFPNEPAPRRR